MTRTLYLHVGAPKSGTTFIQQVLAQNSDLLAERGVLVVGPRLQLIRAAMAVREDKRLATLPPEAAQSWEQVVAKVRDWSGESAIVSYELFAGASQEQATAALSLLEGVEVHVVVTARDLGRAVASAWQEQLKFGLTKSLEEWTPPGEDAPRSEWGWRTMQPANVAVRWGATVAPSRVHIVTVPRVSSDPGELWHRFAAATGLADIPGLDIAVPPANESLGAVEAEVLRRVNVALDGAIDSSRERSVWLRDLLAHHVLAPLGGRPLRANSAQLQAARAQATDAIAAITAAGYSVHGDLDDLLPQGEAVEVSTPDAADVADSATKALAALLSWARTSGADPRSEVSPPQVSPAASGVTPAEAPRGVVDAAKGVVRASVVRATAPKRDRRIKELEARIKELESEVRRARALHLRVATLSDLVSDLLLPSALQRRSITRETLNDYRQDSL